ncbi:MAG: sensor histidine kinase [Xanthobacteraceae bacterium]
MLRIIDWFIPVELRFNTADLWRARIFTISHLLGPCSAIAILGFLYYALEVRDWVFWTICILCGAFWLLPFALRFSRTLAWLALFSFCDLTFVSVFGSYFYGGVSSPFLPWCLAALLIGFFYIGDRPLLVLGIFTGQLAGFCAAYLLNGSFPERLPLSALSTVGMISVLCATLYTSMMAIYYAYVMTAQSALRQEIEKRLQTAAKLKQAKDEAERANEAKAVFLAKMNHQLRTPLNAIIGYSEILLEDIEPDVDTADEADLKTINNAGRHLLSLVSDVLYMPKIDSDNIEISLRPVELETCLEEVASTCRNLVSQNGNEFTFEKSADLGVIDTDQTRLRQILINLLGNAGKFTKNGKVSLRASRVATPAGDQIVMTVADTGIGIPREALGRLFTEFNQASSETSTSYGGTGLGLAVSRRLAQLLNGDIDVESEPGRGSVFTVRLPVAPAIAEAA